MYNSKWSYRAVLGVRVSKLLCNIQIINKMNVERLAVSV